jgi:glycosyltransferase involved in cell wall biosynthesis
MTATPKVSLIMTTYNRERYVETAIQSVLSQLYRDFELIIWDDGSTDNTLNIVRQAAQKDDRVRLIEAPHHGRVGALQAAHDAAIGEYVGWVDSDDVLTMAALSSTVAYLNREPEVGMVYTDYLVMDAGGKVLHLGERCKIPYSRDLLMTNFMTFHFRLIRRSCFIAAGGMDQTFLSAEDYDLCLRISEITEIRHIAEPLYYYRVHPNSLSVGDRLTQINWAKTAIAQSLVRRGLSDRFEVNVELVGRFSIEPKV